MTTRPGVNILQRSAPPVQGIPTDTGVALVVGVTQRGPINTPILIRNLTDYGTWFGDRVTYGVLYDWLDVFFREGGQEVYVIRSAGPNPVTGTRSFLDGVGAAAISVDEIGGYGSMKAQIIAGTVSGFVIVVFDTISGSDVEVERSYDLTTNADAVAWAAGVPGGAAGSKYIRVRSTGVGPPVVAAAATLAGGTDDHGNITDTQKVASLAYFTADLGPGQVAVPGSTTGTVHTALIKHAASYTANGLNRFAVLDATDTPTQGTLTALTDAQRAAANTDESFGAMFAPWLVVPGITAQTTRTVAPSALVSAKMAQNDSVSGSPNVPAAGVLSIANYVLGVTQTYTDAQRQALNDKGVNVIRAMYGSVRVYGYRTMVDPLTNPTWIDASNARLRMAITAEANAIGEQYMFAQLDGKGHKVAEFGGALAGMLNRFYLIGSLFGDTPDDAFDVNVGSTVNTPITLQANELHAVLSVRMSPMAEMTVIEIVKRSILETV